MKKTLIANSFAINYALNSSDLSIKNVGVNYLKHEKSINFKDKIVAYSNMIINSPSRFDALLNLFLQVVSQHSQFIPPLINHLILIDSINEDDCKKIIYELKTSKYDQIRKEIIASYLFKKFNESVNLNRKNKPK